MKRNIKLISVLTFSAVLLIPAITPGGISFLPTAQAQSTRCSEAMIKGSYSIQLAGWIGSGASRVPYASTGTYIADGKGSLSGTDKVIIDGGQPVERTVTATYTVNPTTCTGTATSPAAGTFFFTILDDGKKLPSISTTPGTTVTGVSERQSD